MNEKPSKFRWQDHPWIILAVVVAMPLVVWGVFHPEFRPDAHSVDPTIRRALEKTGFSQTTGVSAVRRENAYTMGNDSWSMTIDEKIVSIDGPITEKRSWRRGGGPSQQTAGLYVGPITVVHYYRNRLPLIGDLLPFQFWSSRRLTKFELEEIERFPNVKGGKMRARVTYEERYAGGKLAERENRRLRCDVTRVVDAASVHEGLSGSAARIDCQAKVEPNGRQLGLTNPETVFVDQIVSSHWYVLNQGWSIPVEGEAVYELSGAAYQANEVMFQSKDPVVRSDMPNQTLTRAWKSRLVSFESTRNNLQDSLR